MNTNRTVLAATAVAALLLPVIPIMVFRRFRAKEAEAR